ncbi:MFS general substrate transporter [Bimuria novae-zelandiae CBS 107.79]|uniref:MFS general substrate transporter n=1 Tax=Bimuria novae-zelandiae CBS 107.79 TaxID=1447943 RepID=A0A6A5UTJ7_9PLEO|nr:MFS general substrate transporter [Bimuria novae-zelandiae CBS 107.79]
MSTSQETIRNDIRTEPASYRRPRDWPLYKKWVATLILSGFTFIQPLAETMLAPVQKPLSTSLAISQGYEWILVNSLILIGVGFSPPAILGRTVFGACTADAVAGGVISDIWASNQRGRAFAAFMTFWITSLATGLFFSLAVVFINETYEPRPERASQPKHSPLDAVLEKDHQRTTEEPETRPNEPQQSIWTHIQRPLRMLATQITIQLLAVYMALLYGTIYGQSNRVSSLNYISAAIGYIAGEQVAGHFNDKIYAILRARSTNNKGLPVFRVPMMLLGTILTPAGLLLWGWTGETHRHWIFPNIGCALFTAACYICSPCVSVYIIDAYVTFAASAVSTNLVLRSNFAAFFPIFALYMFKALGFGYSATVLAGEFGVFGLSTVAILWFWGESLQKRSSYCAAEDLDD